jgi:hypothetical protein
VTIQQWPRPQSIRFTGPPKRRITGVCHPRLGSQQITKRNFGLFEYYSLLNSSSGKIHRNYFKTRKFIYINRKEAIWLPASDDTRPSDVQPVIVSHPTRCGRRPTTCIFPLYDEVIRRARFEFLNKRLLKAAVFFDQHLWKLTHEKGGRAQVRQINFESRKIITTTRERADVYNFL